MVHGWRALYSNDGKLLGDDAGPGEADGVTLDGRRQCGICEQRLPEDAYGDARDLGICRACWQDHDQMVREMEKDGTS